MNRNCENCNYSEMKSYHLNVFSVKYNVLVHVLQLSASFHSCILILIRTIAVSDRRVNQSPESALPLRRRPSSRRRWTQPVSHDNRTSA